MPLKARILLRVKLLHYKSGTRKEIEGQIEMMHVHNDFNTHFMLKTSSGIYQKIFRNCNIYFPNLLHLFQSYCVAGAYSSYSWAKVRYTTGR